jgi:hypothetical protein
VIDVSSFIIFRSTTPIQPASTASQANMCRFLVNTFLPVHASSTDYSQVYKGSDEILLSKLILDPTHSILTQSFDSRLRLDMRRPHNGQWLFPESRALLIPLLQVMDLALDTIPTPSLAQNPASSLQQLLPGTASTFNELPPRLHPI